MNAIIFAKRLFFPIGLAVLASFTAVACATQQANQEVAQSTKMTRPTATTLSPTASDAQLSPNNSPVHPRTTKVSVLNEEREGHTATLLKDGRVLVVGGADIFGPFGFAETYDPASDTWTMGAAMANARGGHTSTLLPDGRGKAVNKRTI